MIHHLATFNKLDWSRPCEGLRLSKLNSADHQKIKKIAHTGLFCSPQSNQAAAIVYGKESIVLKALPAVVVLYFTEGEKDDLRTESYSYKEQTVTFTMHWKTKLCNEK